MIINYLDIERVAAVPAKASAPLIVDANAPLPPAGSAKSLEAVSWRHSQALKGDGRINQLELSPGGLLDGPWKPPDLLSGEDCRGDLVGEGLNHRIILPPCDSIVNR